MRVRVINCNSTQGMVPIRRKDSQGRVHTAWFLPEQAGGAASRLFGRDSVKVTCDGKFKLGDMVRPTKDFIDAVMNGSIPYECIAQWPKGFKIIEIGPEGMPWAGAHDIELEGFTTIGLTNETIEKV